MITLAISAGDWANIGSAVATFFASGVALFVAFKKPKKIVFEFITGIVSNYDEYYKRWSFDDFKHTLSDNTVVINVLSVNMINVDLTRTVVNESGIIVKLGFKKQKFGDYRLKELNQNIANDIDFGHNPTGVGHTLKLTSYKLNPFISNRKISFKVYVKDTRGKVYKSETFKLHNF